MAAISSDEKPHGMERNHTRQNVQGIFPGYLDRARLILLARTMIRKRRHNNLPFYSCVTGDISIALRIAGCVLKITKVEISQNVMQKRW